MKLFTVQAIIAAQLLVYLGCIEAARRDFRLFTRNKEVTCNDLYQGMKAYLTTLLAIYDNEGLGKTQKMMVQELLKFEGLDYRNDEELKQFACGFLNMQEEGDWWKLPGKGKTSLSAFSSQMKRLAAGEHATIWRQVFAGSSLSEKLIQRATNMAKLFVRSGKFNLV